MSDDEKPIFLTAKQVAARYGVSRYWAYHDPNLSRLKYKFGKYIRWKLADLEKFEADAGERGADLARFREWELEKKRAKLKFDLAEKT